MRIKEIKSVIQGLPAKEVSELSVWIADYQTELWDAQIVNDLDRGRRDEVLARIDGEYVAGKATAF